MKTNKILLGVTAVIFAAGAAFASVSSVPQEVYYWQNEASQSNCTQVTLDTECIDEPGVCREGTPHGNRQIFSDPDCENPMRQDTGF